MAAYSGGSSYLSVTSGEHHDEADVLRAALDEQIQLSVDLPVPVLVNQISGAPAPPSTALEISGLFDLVLEGNGRLMIENWWRKESNLPKLLMNKIGVIVVSEQGKKYQFPPWNAPLPTDSIVVGESSRGRCSTRLFARSRRTTSQHASVPRI